MSWILFRNFDYFKLIHKSSQTSERLKVFYWEKWHNSLTILL